MAGVASRVIVAGVALLALTACDVAPAATTPSSGPAMATTTTMTTTALGGATPQEVWTRLVAAQQAGDLVDYARCLTPEKRFGVAMQLWLVFDMKFPGGDLTAAIKGTADQVARVVLDETPEQAARRNGSMRIHMGDEEPNAEARYRAIMARHGLTGITQRTRPSGPAGIFELAAATDAFAEAFVKIDAIAFIDDLVRLVTDMQGGKKPTPPPPVNGEPLIMPTLTSSTVGYRKGQLITFERVDGRWFTEGLPD